MNQLAWQDYLNEEYGGKNISASVNQVHAVLVDALKAGQIADDPVIGFTGLTFREELERSGFSCNMAMTLPKKAKTLSEAQTTDTGAQDLDQDLDYDPQDSEARSDEEFDIQQVVAEMNEGTFETMAMDRGFGGNTEMATEYQQNRDKDSSVYQSLFKDNQGLVASVAKQYLGQAMYTCLTLDDLIGYGNEGLLRAIEKFDPKMGFALSTYATYWIKQSISRHIADDGWMIRLPVHLVEKLNKMHRLEQTQLKQQGEIDVESICAKLEIDQQTYKRYKQIDKQFRATTSLNMLVEAAGDEGSELGDFVTAEENLGIPPAPDPETEAINEEIKQHVRDLVFKGLKPREAQVINFRFGLEDDETHTLEEVGQAMGVTRERIRQIEAKAIRHLKGKMIRGNHKEDYTIE